MAISFSGISLLTANSRSEFFGEQVRFKSTLELTIEGNLLNLTNNNNHEIIHGLINNYESNTFNTSAQFFIDNITINTINFGNGYVTSFKTDPDGTDVNSKKYTANITIPTTGDMSVLSDGTTFNGLSFTDFQYIQSFSESSTYTKGEGIKDSYSQNVSVTLLPKIKTDGKTKASTIIQNFITNNNLTSLIDGTYQKTNIRKKYDQTYDEIANVYTLNCNWIFYPRSSNGTGDSNDNVIVVSNVTVNYDGEGIITITEDGQCTGNQNDTGQKRFEAASAKAKTLLDNAYNRLSSYITDTSKNNSLINLPISKNTTGLPFEGRVNYSITFTNSKEVIESTGYWSFTTTINKTEGGDYTGTESGEITGKKELLANKQKYNFALNQWNNIKNNIKSRISSHVSSVVFKELSSSETHSEVDGRISYNYTFSTNASITTNDVKITKEVASITEDFNRNLYSTFNIVGKKEIAQKQNNLLANEIKVAVTLNGKYTTSISDFLSRAKNIANAHKKGNISDVNYSYSPNNREFSLNVTYFYMP